MNQDEHFLPQEKLLKATGKKIDFEVVKNIQGFSEKIITDIIYRSALLAKHKDGDVIDASEIAMVIEKNFDYSFGMRSLYSDKPLPSNEHTEKMAELSKQK